LWFVSELAGVTVATPTSAVAQMVSVKSRIADFVMRLSRARYADAYMWYTALEKNSHGNEINFSLFSASERANRGRLESLIMIEWFDDLKLGMRFSSDKMTVSKEDILRFAEEFDPQPFHLDEEAAKDTILNGLAASGWHTAAIAMRLAITAKPFGPHPLFGAGVDELRWLKPVRPGDTLHLEGELVELIPSKSKPQGVARVKWTAYNQNGEAVYTFNPIAIVPRRPA
jgi:acyl dehydratase